MVSVATEPLPTGVVTFLLTDIEGSTQAWQAAPGEMTALVSYHYDILESGIAAHGGRRPQEQGEGDSVVAVFADARSALGQADVVFKVAPPEKIEAEQLRAGTYLFSLLDPYRNTELVQTLATRKTIRRFKAELREVASGYERFLGLEGFNDLLVKDQIEFFHREEAARS